jgi:hypothetical protein
MHITPLFDQIRYFKNLIYIYSTNLFKIPFTCKSIKNIIRTDHTVCCTFKQYIYLIFEVEDIKCNSFNLFLHLQSPQLGCACSYSTCCPETCDHVYLFGDDYVDAKDIFGKPMRGRSPYDQNGRLILEVK